MSEIGTDVQAIRAEIDRLNALPCKCVHCDFCRGLGTMRVRYDALGRMEPGYGDDLDDLETCDQCHGGITETCERCMEIEELYSQIEDL